MVEPNEVMIKKEVLGRPELIIDHLILHNFKSYAGTQKIGPFHHKFSCIIGPNGSGKSNIIDAVMFVFGRRAQQLRHRKIADLIHFSSDHPNETYASVEIFLRFIERTDDFKVRNAQDKEPISIARVVYQDSTSKYFLNQQVISPKDLVTFLKPFNVDLNHSRFLILQGEVEQIATLKPKSQGAGQEGLIEYLEDIIGSSTFISDIQALQEDMKQKTEIIQLKRSTMLLVQNQFFDLEDLILTARSVCDVERQILLLRNQLEQKNRFKLCQKMESIQQSLDNVQKEFQNWMDSREENKKEVQKLNAAVEKQEGIVSKAEIMLQQTEEEFSSMERLDNELAAKLAHCVKRLKGFEKDIADLIKEQNECTKTMETLEGAMKQKKEQITKCERTVGILEDRVDALNKQYGKDYEQLRLEKLNSDNLLKPLKLQIGETKVEIEAFQAEKRLIEETLNKSQARVDDMKKTLLTNEKLYEEKQKELSTTNTTLSKLKSQYDKKADEVKTLRQNLTEKKTQACTLSIQLDAKESELSNNRHELLLMPSILRAKKNGLLTGIIDRLWNLGTVEPKYQAAVLAIGGSEYLLVNTTHDAENVVAFVRQKKLGRITCIVMSHIQKTLKKEYETITRQTRLPPQADLLLNYINCNNPEHKLAFFFVLRDVLLADNLDIARQVAFHEKKRWRVVTLEGHLIDKSGAMTGGGSHQLTSRTKLALFQHLSSSQSPNDIGHNVTAQQQIENLKYDLRTIKASILQTQEPKIKAEQHLTMLEENINQLNVLKTRILAEQEGIQKNISFYKETLQNQKLPQLSLQDETIVKELCQKIQKNTHLLEEQEKKMSKFQENVDRICLKIENIGGGSRKKAFNALTLAKKELNDTILELEESRVKVEVLKQRFQTVTQLIPQKKKELANEQKKQERLLEERNGLTDRAELTLQKKEELEKILQEQKKICVDYREALKTLLNESRKAELQEVKYQTQLHDLNQTVMSVHHEISCYEKKISRLNEEWKNIPIFDDELLYLLSQKKKQNNTVTILPDQVKKTEAQLPVIEHAILEQLDEVFLCCEIKKYTESILSDKIDFGVVENFKDLSKKLKNQTSELEDLCTARDQLRKQLDTLESTRLTTFTQGFHQIANDVKEMYQMLTHEGDAELELADPLAPFTHGVTFSVRPPKKSWKHIENLSGGEKTLSSLALVFAFQKFRPTPIYFLDEIDAALDHTNVSTIALYIASQALSAQFIIISLRNHMFELANRLFGVYKLNANTHFLTIDPDVFVEKKEEIFPGMSYQSNEEQGFLEFTKSLDKSSLVKENNK